MVRGVTRGHLGEELVLRQDNRLLRSDHLGNTKAAPAKKAIKLLLANGYGAKAGNPQSLGTAAAT
jgi:hypothetical protein